MRKNRIRLTESQLHRVIKESVTRVLNEIGDTSKGQYMLGRLAHRKGEGTDTKGRMRKDKEKYPIFNYADKAATKADKANGTDLRYGHDFKYGRNHERVLNIFDNETDHEEALRDAASYAMFSPWLDHFLDDQPDEYTDFAPIEDDTPREKLRKIFDYDNEYYFPKK